VRFRALVGLTVIWVLMWGDPSVANVLSGLLLALLVTRLSRLPVPRTRARYSPVGCLRLLLWFARELLLSACQVAWQAVRPGPQPANSIIAVTLRTDSDLTLTIVALTVCAIPGSLVLEVRRSTGTLFIHVLGVSGADGLERARRSVRTAERRVVDAIGTREDRRLLREGNP